MALQASSKVKGITIEIGADTTSFGYAMGQLRTQAGTVAKDLKNVENALKLDPSNIQTAADKLKLLRESADNASKKVETIKKAIEALNKEYTDKSSKEYRDQLEYLERQLESASREQEIANARLKDFETNADTAGKSAMSLGDIIKGNLISQAIMSGLKGLVNLAKSIAHELSQAAKAVWNFSKEVVNLAAAYEDALGYSEQLFGSQADSLAQWVKDNSVALRIAVSDLQIFANNIGTAFNALGLSQSKAIEFTQNIISLSADIRAATGKDIEEINAALTRGFTSSLRNFRQFGLYISEADIKIQALKDGVIEFTGDQDALTEAMNRATLATADFERAMDLYEEGSEEYTAAEEAANAATEALNAILGEQEVQLTSSERTISLYNLVMEKFGFLVGQNERESKLYNSQLASMKTLFSNIKLEIGERLLPVFQTFLDKVIEFTQTEEFSDLLDTIYDSVKNIADSVTNFIESGQLETYIQWMTDNLPNLGTKISEVAGKIANIVDNIWNMINAFNQWKETTKENAVDFLDSLPWISNLPGRASGGYVSAGQIYRINDDAGRRTEMFIPAVPGTILNGNQTDKIINNTNNSRTVGDVNIYLTATGTNASAIADQIGEEVQRRLRMSGAYLY